MKYTVKFEDHKHSLNFLNISITSNTPKKKTNSKCIERTQWLRYILNETHA